MKILKLIFLSLLCFVAACTATKPEPANPIVTITGGKVQGVLTDSSQVMVYKGIPYAAPPVGNLRWKKPQPVQPWDTVMIADHFGNAAIQPDHQPGEFYQKEFYWQGDPERNEDCLYLNIWTPAAVVGKTEAHLPVAMWVHGGAYMAGWGHEVTMDGDAWAKRGVILVTINYRLGVLGFLSHPALSAEDPDHTSGNYGTYDQVAALKWIKENIAQFGGDPDNIMVFGQSAGAASIKNLVSSPLSRGLVSGAIIQSIGGIGDLIPPMTAEMAEQQGKAIMDAGQLTTLEQMRAATPAQLDSALAAYRKASGIPFLMLSPHLDGKLLVKDFTSATYANEIADVPYMIGSTLNDLGDLIPSEIKFCQVRDSLSQRPAFTYLFARPLPGDSVGAYHSSELWYVFHTLKNGWRPFTAADYDLSDRMVDCWTNFAKFGNPNADNQDGEWKACTRENPFVMEFKIK